MRRPNSMAAMAMALLIALCMTCGGAAAGDRAERRIIGFSPDGSHFAFEQYGVQDGSGFPYAEIYVIDTGADTWLPDTPIRKVIETDGAKVGYARASAAKEAQGLLARLKIGQKGKTLANKAAAADKSGVQRLKFDSGRPGKPVILSLEQRTLPSAECAKYTEAPMNGFTLSLQTVAAPMVLHRDEALPESRGCALGYSIAEVIRHGTGAEKTYAVLIRMQKHGFEGPDTRYLAVTRRLP